MTRVVPVLVAVMVWMIRVLIIGTFSLAGDNMFSMAEARASDRSAYRPMPAAARAQPVIPYARPAPKPIPGMRPPAPAGSVAAVEPTYHPIGLSARPSDPKPPMRG